MTQTQLKLQLTDRQTADFELIGNGGFAPLTGPQGSEDWKSVVESMTLADGAYWPIPITLGNRPRRLRGRRGRGLLATRARRSGDCR